jgi:uncharacterized protein (TIGR03435 family)
MINKALLLAVVAGFGTSLLAQAPEPFAFEVASIKVNKLGPTAPQRMSNLPPGERVIFNNVTARNLIQIAYTGFADIVGGPDWMGAAGPPTANQERFDVNAKAERASTHEELVAMMKTLLAERFKLVAHTEQRERDVYALRLAKVDGTWGPQLRRATFDCAALRAAATDLASRQAAAAACGTIGSSGPPLHLHGVPITQLRLSGLDRPVVDKTGLTGNFDLDLSWTPVWFQDPATDRSRFPNVDPNGPTIFTALQEQLGLKLVAERDAQHVLVIDHIEKPTED